MSAQALRAALPRRLAPLALAAGLQACGGPAPVEDGPPLDGLSRELPADAQVRDEPRSRYGNPDSYVVYGRRYHVMRSSEGYVERGVASWYGRKFHGRRTSSGEPYDMHRMTAAHKSLPLPTYVEVTNLRNGRRAVVRVNDRGPFHDNRIIDLSYAAATKLGILGNGTGLVEIRALSPRRPTAQPVALTQPAPAPGAGAPSIYLQAGAFSLRANAEGLRTRLASMPAMPVSVQEAVVDAGLVYRVRIGPLADVDEADRIAAAIVDAGMDLPRIVIE